MPTLSASALKQIRRHYRNKCGLRPRRIGLDGYFLVEGNYPDIERLPRIAAARAHALQEAIRWGEPYIFFTSPGVLSWVVPMVSDQLALGGLTGGEVLADSSLANRRDCFDELVALGAPLVHAERFLRGLTEMDHGAQKEAADFLFVTFYQISGWTPSLLMENREEANQQREIAEEIHARKVTGNRHYPIDEERKLLALIRAGDRKEARHVLNRMIGAMMTRSPNLAVMRAQMIELMGYLTRAAVMDSPHLEPLLERNHEWMAQIVEASDFETLASVTRQSMDEFIANIYLYGYNPSNKTVRKALDYIAEHFTETVRLEDAAKHVHLSRYRLAHLIKEVTGHSLIHHVHRLRIQYARELLEESDISGSEIAYKSGFGDQSYFIKVFRQATGLTPARYQRQFRQLSSAARNSD